MAMIGSGILNSYLENAGSNNMVVDGSSTPVEFSYTAVKKTMIRRLLLYISGATAFDETKFGGIAALTNGVDIICDETSIANWKDNIDIQTGMYDFESAGELYGKADKVARGRWSLYKINKEDVGLILPTNAVFRAVVNDDLTGLLNFRVRIQGDVYGHK